MSQDVSIRISKKLKKYEKIKMLKNALFMFSINGWVTLILNYALEVGLKVFEK